MDNNSPQEQIPVCNTPEQVKAILARFPDHKFCLLLGAQTPETDQPFPGVIFLPVNSAPDDLPSLRGIYTLARENDQIIAIYHANSHANNPVLRDLYGNSPTLPANIDALIVNDQKDFLPYDLKGDKSVFLSLLAQLLHLNSLV